MTKSQKNEGEGNRTAARAYNKEQRAFIESGKVEKSAEKARKAIDSDEASACVRPRWKG